MLKNLPIWVLCNCNIAFLRNKPYFTHLKSQQNLQRKVDTPLTFVYDFSQKYNEAYKRTRWWASMNTFSLRCSLQRSVLSWHDCSHPGRTCGKSYEDSCRYFESYSFQLLLTCLSFCIQDKAFSKQSYIGVSVNRQMSGFQKPFLRADNKVWLGTNTHSLQD